MIVVADTSPLNYLVLLGFPEVLQNFYGEVVVPDAVLFEMRHPDSPAVIRDWAFGPPYWIRNVSVRSLDNSLPVRLGDGEREAISLALELDASLLLIDEVVGRREAQARNLKVTGVLTVILQASLRGYCEFFETLERLQRLGFWVSGSTKAAIVRDYEVRRREEL